MGAGDRLRRLDRYVLPRLARILPPRGGNEPPDGELPDGELPDGETPGGRGRRIVLGVLAVVSCLVVLAAVHASSKRPAGDPTVGDWVRVGVTEGQSIPGYVQTARDKLDGMAGATPAGPPAETYALVSLTAYLAPDRLAGALPGVAPARVYARVPLPGQPTEIVGIDALALPADVLAGMADVATRKDREAADYQRLADKLTGDSPAERAQREVYLAGGRLAVAEATAYRQRCSCVYAAVVRAVPAALRGLLTRPEVRAVDPAPEIRRLDRTVFLPPLPEQTGFAGPPAAGPDPSTSPTVGADPPKAGALGGR